MKMRIQANAIRFRLNRKEVAELAQAGQVQESVEFGPAAGQGLVYALEVDPELSSVAADYQEGRISTIVTVPGKRMVRDRTDRDRWRADTR